MVVSCVAYGCKEKFRKGSGISFHRFPVDVQIRKQWVVALRRKNFYPSEHSRVCSKHFSLDSFNKEAFGIGAILKRNAVPTIFNFPSYLLPPTSKKRKSPAKRKVHEESVSLSSFITEDKAHPKRGKHKRTAFNRTKKKFIGYNNSSEMDTRLEVKEEHTLLDVASQNEREFLSKDAVMKTNSNVVLLGDECDVVIKTEIKSEVPFPDFDSQNKRVFLPEVLTMKDKEHSNNYEMDNKIEIKEEPWWLEAETSSFYDNIKAFNEIKTTSIRCNNSCEMDTKLELKEEDALSDIASQNEREFFPKDAVMKSNCDDVLLGDDHDVVIKTEIKSEVPTP